MKHMNIACSIALSLLVAMSHFSCSREPSRMFPSPSAKDEGLEIKEVTRETNALPLDTLLTDDLIDGVADQATQVALRRLREDGRALDDSSRSDVQSILHQVARYSVHQRFSSH